MDESRQTPGGSRTPLPDLLRIIWEDSAAGLLITDEQGVFLHANAAYCAMVGYSAEELIGQSFLMIAPPEYRDMYAVLFEKVTSARRTGSSGEFEVRRKDGRLITLLTHDSLLETPEGIRHFFVNYDITEQKALEQRRLHANRMSALGTLAGGVAHEFNNLLVSILGYAELIQAKRDSSLETLLDFANKIERAARRGRELTAQLLPFAHPEAARRKQTVELHHVIREAAEMFQLSAPAVPVLLALEADPAILAGDPIQLQQVFLNLLRCAAAARAEPGQPVSLRTRRVQESMRLGHDKPITPYEFLLVEVSPEPVRHGTATSGEEPMVAPDPFEERSGLSMALVYGSITGHGGWMASGEGELRIWLPALSRTLS